MWSGIPWHAQNYAKLWVNFISRMIWVIKLVFGMWLEIHRSYKFVQSCQVGVARHAESDWKQQVSFISKVTSDVKLIFCVWLGIHKYIDLIQSIHMVVVRHTWACQKYFPILNPQNVETIKLCCWFLHKYIGIHRNSKLIRSFQAV